MSLIPSFFSVKPNVYDPFGLDLWGYPLGDAIPNGRSLHASSYTDWKETPEAHVFRIDLPGFNKNEVKVEVAHEKVLQISGERKKEVEEKNDKWHRVERSHGKFVRRFRLPDNTKVDQVKAGLENGVLTVTVPKEEEHRASQGRFIEISN